MIGQRNVINHSDQKVHRSPQQTALYTITWQILTVVGPEEGIITAAVAMVLFYYSPLRGNTIYSLPVVALECCCSLTLLLFLPCFLALRETSFAQNLSFKYYPNNTTVINHTI